MARERGEKLTKALHDGGRRKPAKISPEGHSTRRRIKRTERSKSDFKWTVLRSKNNGCGLEGAAVFRPPEMPPKVKEATNIKRHGGGFGRRV